MRSELSIPLSYQELWGYRLFVDPIVRLGPKWKNGAGRYGITMSYEK